MAIGDQTLFVPSNVRGLRFSNLPQSRDLAAFLRKLRISNLGDLDGVSLREFKRVSNNGTAVFLEIGRLIEGARKGTFAKPPPQRMRSKEVSGGSDFICNPQRVATSTSAMEAKQSGEAAAEPPENESVIIPQAARGQTIEVLSLSVRLRHVLERKGIRILGDLHGLCERDFLSTANCGKKTVVELMSFVRSLQTGATQVDSRPFKPVIGGSGDAPLEDGCFCVPPAVKLLCFADLPISVRLGRVLTKKGFAHLGQLDGVSVRDLLSQKNCGKRTISELVELLRQAANGTFDLPESCDGRQSCANAVRLIDSAFGKLPARNQQIVLWRLGGFGGEPLTLEQVGDKFKLTRERVRQVVEKAIPAIRKSSGPKMAHFLRQIPASCEEIVCPLTPELLAHWLGAETSQYRFPMSFYVRLLRELNPAIPAWPRGHDGHGSQEPDGDEAMIELQSLLRERGSAFTSGEALQMLRNGKFTRLSTSGFLRALRECRSLKINFKSPTQPEINLGRLRAVDLARAVLRSSDGPLQPEEMLAQAEKMFTPDLIEKAPRALSNCLTPEQGFYLLGPRAYGLRQHFRLPDEDWQTARTDFAQMLKKKNRPVSTPDFLIEHGSKWNARVNSYELAQILREDKRFVDLGKWLFALEAWGIEERVHIKDLVTRILKETGRLMTAAQILERMDDFRSVSGSSMPTNLRSHPLVRDYGFGHFGLKTWNEKAKAWMVGDAPLVDRIIRRAEPPVTFSRVCEIVGIPPHGTRANKLWDTCSALGSIIRNPEEPSPDTKLIHKRCGLERALAATARGVGRPLPAYEIQWELNERFGSLFANRPLTEVERCLDSSPVFVRDASNNFVLEVHLDQMGFDVAGICRACFDILAQTNEIVSCEDLLDRLEGEGKNIGNLSPDILASILRSSEELEEIGRDRFRKSSCKH